MSGRFGRLARDAQSLNVLVEVRADLDGPDKLEDLLTCIKECCEQGAGTTVTVETGGGEQGSFYFDGDGADRLIEIKSQRV
jgi:hypothetical protein